MIKKAVSIILTGILCLSMVSCAAPGNNPADSSAADSSEKTAAENGSAEIAAAGSSAEIDSENFSEDVDYTTGTPWMCIDLLGNVTADTPTDPKDNFAL